MDDNLGQAMAQVPAKLPSLGGFWRIARRHIAMIAAVTALCLLGALAYLQQATPLYRGTARFTVEPAGLRQTSASSQVPQLGNFLRTQSERVTSRAILALALGNPDLKDVRTFARVPSRLNTLRQGLTIDIGRTDDTISVSFDTPYADEAPRIANAVVDAYKRYQTQPAQSSSSDVVALYDGQLDKLRRDLDATTAKMQAIEQKYGVLSSNAAANEDMNQRRLAAISQELTIAQFETLKAKTDFDDANEALPKDASNSPATKNPAKPLIVSAEQEEKLRSEMTDLEARREAFRLRYLPDHPAIQELARRIQEVNREYVAAVQQRWLLAMRREQQLQTGYDAEQKRIVDLGARTADYERLAADADHLHKSIDNLESRIQAIEVTRDSSGVDIDFFDPAETSFQSHPRWGSTLAMTLLLGLMLGAGAALLRESMDDRLRSSEEIRASAGLPVLGAVPQMPFVMSLSVAAQKVAVDSSSEVAEAYRAIRAAIDSRAPRDRCRTIVVTSPDASDGKTTSASNLAIAMAQVGKRVLLIDAVLREPTLHAIYSVSPNAGLGGILSGQVSIPQKTIRKTALNGLWVLPAGLAPADPTDLLNSPELPELLMDLADDYDHIIIDAPPVTGAPDARIIAASCDLTLLVVRADTATRRRTNAARDALIGVGAHLLGLILTHAPREAGSSANGGSSSRRNLPADIQPDEDIIDISASSS